jgi:hypothetical protein
MSRLTSLHCWGAATRTMSGATTAISVGSYSEGQLFVRVLSLSGTNPRLRPRWEAAPGADTATAGPFAPFRSMGTFLATGIAVVSLCHLGAWGRPAFTVGGTSAAIRVQSWFVGKW